MSNDNRPELFESSLVETKPRSGRFTKILIFILILVALIAAGITAVFGNPFNLIVN